MKEIDEVVVLIERRLVRTWHLTLGGDDAQWPHAFGVGSPSASVLADDFAAAQDWALAWHDWARSRGLELTYRSRRAQGTRQSLPTHVIVPDADTAARIVGGDWPARLARGRLRLRILRERFPAHEQPWTLVRQTDGYSEVDFGLLCDAAAWFQENSASGLSPRQVPIAGLHAKWLDKHCGHVLALAGVGDLGLVEVRPNPIQFTYLDPDHRAAGRRVHDSVSPGFWMEPEYQPQVVVISENKDTCVVFPEVPRAISVQGHGNAGPSLICRVKWIADAPRIFYWGDLDARGFEIVNDYRRFGLPIETILMDATTLERFARFQADVDERGNPLGRSPRKALPYLTGSERETYELLTDPDGTAPIRVEQERIPLDVAYGSLMTALATPHRLLGS